MGVIQACLNSFVKHPLSIPIKNAWMGMNLGERIQERLDELDGKVAIADVAKACGVKPQSVYQWINGDTKGPKPGNLIAAARALRTSPEWLATGHGQKDASTVLESPQATYQPESPEISRLIVAFGWLTDDQKKSMLADLESKAETNKTISRQLGPRWEIKADADVAKIIKPAPKSPPERKHKRAGHGEGGRPPSAPLDDIPEDK